MLGQQQKFGPTHKRCPQHYAALPSNPSRRTACVVLNQGGIMTDNTTRVKGNIRAVYNWVADLGNAGQWRAGVSAVRVTRGAGKPLNLRHQWELQQEFGIVGTVPTVYEIVDMDNKRVVYSAGSELHTATEQLIFMPDPNDPSFTVVRHVSNIQLTEWRRALQPMVAGLIKKLPEQGLHKLRDLLNSPDTPIRHVASHSRSAEAATSGWNFTNMFANLKREMSQEGRGTTRVSVNAAKAAAQLDALGYYAALGLDARQYKNVGSDEVKAAFRRAAQTLHPDKFSMADEVERLEAEENFKKVQRAYEVLRDPEQRKLYNEGKLQPELEEAY